MDEPTRAIILLRVRNPEYDSSKSIKMLLKQLGLPRECWDTNSFWNNSRQNLEYILYDARAAYRQLAKKLHPRLHTDSEEEAKKLHSMMREVEKRFNDHLNPKSYSEKFVRRVVAEKQAKPIVILRCGHELCGKKFEKTGKRQLYCSEVCCNAARDRRNNKKKVERARLKAEQKRVRERERYGVREQAAKLREISDKVVFRDGRIWITE